jgi:hypothetical protein
VTTATTPAASIYTFLLLNVFGGLVLIFFIQVAYLLRLYNL